MPFFVPHVRDPQTVTYASALTFDARQADLFFVTLGGNAAITLTGFIPGQSAKVQFTQDGTGSRVPTYASGTSVIWSGGTHTLSTAAGAVDVVTYTCTGNGTYLADLKTAYA